MLVAKKERASSGRRWFFSDIKITPDPTLVRWSAGHCTIRSLIWCNIHHTVPNGPFWFLYLFPSAAASLWRNLQFKWGGHEWCPSLSWLAHSIIFSRRDWKVAKKLAKVCRLDRRLLFSLASIILSVLFINLQLKKKFAENILLNVIFANVHLLSSVITSLVYFTCILRVFLRYFAERKIII